MTTALLRIALTSDGGKWAPGTILAAYTPDTGLGAGELAGFHCLKVSSAKYTLEDLRSMRCAKVLDLKALTTPALLTAKQEQKSNIQVTFARAFLGSPARVSVRVPELTVETDLETIVDFDKLTLNDCAEEFAPKLIEVVGEDALKTLEHR